METHLSPAARPDSPGGNLASAQAAAGRPANVYRLPSPAPQPIDLYDSFADDSECLEDMFAEDGHPTALFLICAVGLATLVIGIAAMFA